MSNGPAPNESSGNFGSMGLRGWYATIGNSTIMLVVTCLFVWSWLSADSRSRGDLKDFRETSAAQWRSVADGQAALTRMDDAIRELTAEVRELNRRARRAKGADEEAAKPAIQANEGKP